MDELYSNLGDLRAILDSMMEAIENEDDDEMESLTDDYGVLTNVIYSQLESHYG